MFGARQRKTAMARFKLATNSWIESAVVVVVICVASSNNGLRLSGRTGRKRCVNKGCQKASGNPMEGTTPFDDATAVYYCKSGTTGTTTIELVDWVGCWLSLNLPYLIARLDPAQRSNLGYRERGDLSTHTES